MKYIFFIIAGLFAINCYISYDLHKKSKNIKFVDTAYLYNNFKLKQEFEKTFNDVKQLKQQQLDSLYEVISIIKSSRSGTDTKQLESRYLFQRNKMAEEQESLRASYDTQIWTQLNTLVKKFGEQNNIDLIMGANGQGSIMHGKSEMNISEEVTKFINEKYNGK